MAARAASTADAPFLVPVSSPDVYGLLHGPVPLSLPEFRHELATPVMSPIGAQPPH